MHHVQIVECDADIRSTELFFIVFLNRVQSVVMICIVFFQSIFYNGSLVKTTLEEIIVNTF